MSAIRNADRIIFIEKGRILEDGTHEELIKLQGQYYTMMKAGNMDQSDDQNSLDVDNENTASEKIMDKQLFLNHPKEQKIQESGRIRRRYNMKIRSINSNNFQMRTRSWTNKWKRKILCKVGWF